ncbi:MAG: ABC transporter substrate-binding protein [Nitrospirota bacterium]|nr:ABC transporter substrate-binding protein [Nitrospirota bacterium]
MLLKKFFGIIALSLVLCSLMGCVEQNHNSKEQILTIGYGKDTNVASPKMMDFMPEMMVLERLIEYRDGEVLPSLATSWEIKDNGKTIVFHLKKDIKFSDGSPFTAEDVKFTFDRAIVQKSFHWTEADRIKSIEVIDPLTIAFHYENGKEGYIALFAFGEYHCSIMSPVSVEPKGNISGKIVNPIGTGQWKVDEYVKDQHTIFVRNENYHSEKPKLDKIIIKVIPDAETRVLALRSGEIDMIVDYYHGGSSYTPRNLLEPLKSEGFNVIKNEMPMTMIINFNYKKEPWNDVRVRKAVNYAIDKDEVSVLFDNWVNPAKHGLYSEQGPYIKEANVEAYPNDINKAKTLLKNAGYGELKADFILQGENPDEVKLGELIQAQLKKIDIQVKLSVLEGGAYSERRNKGDYDLMINYIGGAERRSYTRTDGRFNPNAPEFKYGAYDDPELTDILEKAVSSFDGNERQKEFKQFYQLLHEKAGVVPLYYDAVFIVADKKVQGIKYVSSEPCFSGVWIE